MNDDKRWVTQEQSQELLKQINWKSLNVSKWNSFFICIASAIVASLVSAACAYPNINWESVGYVFVDVVMFAAWVSYAYIGHWTRPHKHNLILCYTMGVVSMASGLVSATTAGKEVSWIAWWIVLALFIIVRVAARDLASATLVEMARKREELLNP